MEKEPKKISGYLPFSQKIKDIIKKIPQGKVTTYGQIATGAGNPRATRLVVWILNSSSEKERLPWHRVINGKGQISLKPGQGYEIQKELLRKEGVKFGENDTVDFERYLWTPSYRLKSNRSGKPDAKLKQWHKSASRTK